MKLTIKVENQKVYDSLIQLFQSIGVTIIENAKTFSKTNSTIKKIHLILIHPCMAG